MLLFVCARNRNRACLKSSLRLPDIETALD